MAKNGSLLKGFSRDENGNLKKENHSFDILGYLNPKDKGIDILNINDKEYDKEYEIEEQFLELKSDLIANRKRTAPFWEKIKEKELERKSIKKKMLKLMNQKDNINSEIRNILYKIEHGN